MAQKPNFPGMNPYLEHPTIWPEVHYGLISCLMRMLNRCITPKYRAALEKRVYTDTLLVGIPDTTVFKSTPEVSSSPQPVAILPKPERVQIPTVIEVREPYLEIREISTNRVITVVEVLSPANKRSGEGRQKYLAKRQRILNSQTHLVEIDLLRTGISMPLEGGRTAAYQIVISRSQERPSAERYPFDLDDPIPCFLFPLGIDDKELVIDLAKLLEQSCEESAIDLSIDYAQPPIPSLSDNEQRWLAALIN
ncbi:hypothetical protein N836_00525 [Leptolyngbya sp. Heron Island J]|uniref:DUF4058 family protein n=1 Tax=Leptolyngbya sp. Heron Island J TaxID=1385935 RepID=UPI0003B93925|nr:DUF4058 family protein [Leptolyngbya sp. Heron Island J]ESA36391.1 hypothetical protein N836_00525 [Leptolyngbya sp. Heron Island J]